MAHTGNNGQSNRCAEPGSSRLLSLPPELRNEIYSYVLGGRAICLRFVHSARYTSYIYFHKHYPDLDRLTQSTHNFALLQTCRQIHVEAHTLPFELNIFDYGFVVGRSLSEQRVQWVRTVSLPEFMLGDAYGPGALHKEMATLPGVTEVQVRPDSVTRYAKPCAEPRRLRTEAEKASYKEIIVEALGRAVEVKFLDI